MAADPALAEKGSGRSQQAANPHCSRREACLPSSASALRPQLRRKSCVRTRERWKLRRCAYGRDNAGKKIAQNTTSTQTRGGVRGEVGLRRLHLHLNRSTSKWPARRRRCPKGPPTRDRDRQNVRLRPRVGRCGHARHGRWRTVEEAFKARALNGGA